MSGPRHGTSFIVKVCEIFDGLGHAHQVVVGDKAKISCARCSTTWSVSLLAFEPESEAALDSAIALLQVQGVEPMTKLQKLEHALAEARRKNREALSLAMLWQMEAERLARCVTIEKANKR